MTGQTAGPSVCTDKPDRGKEPWAQKVRCLLEKKKPFRPEGLPADSAGRSALSPVDPLFPCRGRSVRALSSRRPAFRRRRGCRSSIGCRSSMWTDPSGQGPSVPSGYCTFCGRAAWQRRGGVGAETLAPRLRFWILERVENVLPAPERAVLRSLLRSDPRVLIGAGPLGGRSASGQVRSENSKNPPDGRL